MNTLTAKTRIEYLDALRGFSILWVVLIHLDTDLLPEFIRAPYRLPMFFFMSGFFFRPRPFVEFIKKRVNSLIIPFFAFLLISYLCQIFNIEVLQRLFTTLDFPNQANYNSNLIATADIFTGQWPEGVQNPITNLNGPLWFLVALFVVQMVFYSFYKPVKNKKLQLAVALCSIIVVEIVVRVATKYNFGNFMYLALGLSFYKYYVLGCVVGPLLVKLIKQWPYKLIVLIIGFGILIANFTFEIKSLNLFINSIAFTGVVFVVIQEIYQFKRIRILEFFGLNSLQLLVTHMLIINLIFAFPLEITILSPQITVLVQFLLLLTIEYFLILLLNARAPYIVNKKAIFK